MPAISGHEARWPVLSFWMEGANADHPLWPLLLATPPAVIGIVDSLEAILAVLEHARPTRLPSKRKAFRQLRVESQLLEMRSELMIAAMLGDAGRSFVLGRNGSSNPDLVLDTGLGIEVTAKGPEGIADLYEEIEEALRPLQRYSVTLRFSDYPLRLRSEVRSALVDAIRAIALEREGSGEGGVAVCEVVDPRNGSDVLVQAVVLPTSTLVHGLRVTWEVDSGPIGPALAAVEAEVLEVLEQPRKRRQALSMPTVLAVDLARLGAGWMRPPEVWARSLASSIPASCPFVALAVFVGSLDKSDTVLALAIAPSASEADRELLDSLASDLALDPW